MSVRGNAGDEVADQWFESLDPTDRDRILDNGGVLPDRAAGVRRVRPRLEGMRASGVPLTVAGAENRDTWYGAAAAWLAEGTGADLVELPGGHGGFVSHPRTSSSWCAASSADLLAWWRPRRTRTDELPIMSRILRVGLDGSRRIDPAHAGCAVAPDGSRSIQTDRLDDHGMTAHPTKNRMPRQAGKRMGLALWAGSRPRRTAVRDLPRSTQRTQIEPDHNPGSGMHRGHGWDRAVGAAH